MDITRLFDLDDYDSGESSEGEDLGPMFKMMITQTAQAIAPDGVTMDEMYEAWTAVKSRKELTAAAAGGTVVIESEDDDAHLRESALASMYELFITHVKLKLRMDFAKVRNWPVEHQLSESTKLVREAPTIASRFTRGTDPVPFVPPYEENNHAVTVIYDYLMNKMKDERQGKVTKDDWNFLRSMDTFNPGEMEYNPMTWAHLYGIWAHAMNVTEEAHCAR